MERFPCLQSEIDCINNHLGTAGLLDALEYMKTYQAEYEGTQVFREFKQFCREMGALFA